MASPITMEGIPLSTSAVKRNVWQPGPTAVLGQIDAAADALWDADGAGDGSRTPEPTMA